MPTLVDVMSPPPAMLIVQGLVLEDEGLPETSLGAKANPDFGFVYSLSKSISTHTLAMLGRVLSAIGSSNLTGRPTKFAMEKRNRLLNRCTWRSGNATQTATMEDSASYVNVGGHLKTRIGHPAMHHSGLSHSRVKSSSNSKLISTYPGLRAPTVKLTSEA